MATSRGKGCGSDSDWEVEVSVKGKGEGQTEGGLGLTFVVCRCIDDDVSVRHRQCFGICKRYRILSLLPPTRCVSN